MMRLALSLVAAVALLSGFSTASSANDWFRSGTSSDVYASTTQLPLVAIGDCNGDCACDDGCNYDDCCGGCGGGIIVDADIMFMQYKRGTNLNTDDFFDYDPSARLVLGYQNAEGGGIRMRWWDYDHSGTGTFDVIAGPGSSVNVDTFNIDFEGFLTVQLDNLTTLELSGGVRYNDFEETVRNAAGAIVQADQFSGFGGIVGMKVRRDVLGGAAYANVNHAILMDDHKVRVAGGALLFTRFDQPVTQTEIGTGYEWISYTDGGAKVWLRAGYEWWMWTDYVHDELSFFNTSAGFGGFVLGGGMQF